MTRFLNFVFFLLLAYVTMPLSSAEAKTRKTTIKLEGDIGSSSVQDCKQEFTLEARKAAAKRIAKKFGLPIIESVLDEDFLTDEDVFRRVQFKKVTMENTYCKARIQVYIDPQQLQIAMQDTASAQDTPAIGVMFKVFVEPEDYRGSLNYDSLANARTEKILREYNFDLITADNFSRVFLKGSAGQEAVTGLEKADSELAHVSAKDYPAKTRDFIYNLFRGYMQAEGQEIPEQGFHYLTGYVHINATKTDSGIELRSSGNIQIAAFKPMKKDSSDISNKVIASSQVPAGGVKKLDSDADISSAIADVVQASVSYMSSDAVEQMYQHINQG